MHFLLVCVAVTLDSVSRVERYPCGAVYMYFIAVSIDGGTRKIEHSNKLELLQVQLHPTFLGTLEP